LYSNANAPNGTLEPNDDDTTYGQLPMRTAADTAAVEPSGIEELTPYGQLGEERFSRYQAD
jgi:hypothetical protein